MTKVPLSSGAAGAYIASRGTRAGGDGYQCDHWRHYSLLVPPDPIGVMDPEAASWTLHKKMGSFCLSRADVEALDVIGWNVDPNAHTYNGAGAVQPVLPPADQNIPANRRIAFEWESSPFPINGWALYIHQGGGVPDEDIAFRTYDDLFSPRFTLSAAESLPPGTYTWEVTASLELGNQYSGYRRFTVLCPSDFNQDGFITGDDFDGYSSAFLEGDPIADFNGDGFVTGDDFDAFIDAFTTGC